MTESRRARRGSIFNVFLQTSFMDDPWHKVNQFIDVISPPHLDITVGNCSHRRSLSVVKFTRELLVGACWCLAVLSAQISVFLVLGLFSF